MTSNFNEATIRDYIAGNLNFIEPGLTLIEKEHRLENLVGARGFVDILAKDKLNNYVVIEIKRSQQASRQTLQEIFKYIALLKQNYHARESEIRCIILSTHWGELLVPFSELRYQTTVDITGFKLNIDEEFRPVQVERIEPLDVNTLQRQFARTYWFDLYLTMEKRDAAISVLQGKCKTFGLSDFVIVMMDVLRGKERGVMYPYATCFAFQSQSSQTYLELLQQSEHLDMEDRTFESDDEKADYLENILLTELLEGRYSDSGEIGSPEKMDSELARDNWQIVKIYRHGSFASDPRYDDELLMNELKGLDGSNSSKFLNICESTHQDRLKEIRTKSQVAVQHNRNWQQHIDQVFEYLQNSSSPYRLIVQIYSPSSVFDSLIRTLAGSAYNYLPIYSILGDYTDKDELVVFNGYLCWNGKNTDEHAIVDFFKDEKRVFTTKFIDSMVGHHDVKLMKLFQLEYRHRISLFNRNELKEDCAFKFKNGVVMKTRTVAKSIEQWISDNSELKSFLLKLAEMEVYGYR